MSTSIISPALNHQDFSSVPLNKAAHGAGVAPDAHGDLETDSLSSQGYTTSDATDEMTHHEQQQQQQTATSNMSRTSQDTVKEAVSDDLQHQNRRKSMATTVSTRDTDSGTSSSSEDDDDDDDEEEHRMFMPVEDDYDPPTTSTTLNDSLFNEMSLQDDDDNKAANVKEEKAPSTAGVAITTNDTIQQPQEPTATAGAIPKSTPPLSQPLSSAPLEAVPETAPIPDITTTTSTTTTTTAAAAVAVPPPPPSPPVPSKPTQQHQPPAKPDPINTTKSGLFGIWSTIKSAGRRTSDQQDTPLVVEHRTLSTEDRQKRILNRRSVSQPMLGQDTDILQQMEQLNVANINDPKVRMLANAKRKSVRQSLVNQNKGVGYDYDWDFWAGLLCDYEQTRKSKKFLLHNVELGIPPSIRGMVWQMLSESKNHELQDHYIDLLNTPSPYEKMIQRDLARTFPGHKFFKERDGVGQEGLYNVVRAYSVYDQEVGYCQGLAFVVGPLLLNMPDDEAFCVLVKLMSKYGFRGHFTPDMEGLHLRLYQFDALVEEYLPHVSRHLQQQGVGSTMYASQWFMTLFAYKFPLELVFRIYDLILTEGVRSIFQFAIAVLKRNETTILGLDFEHLLNFLKNGLFEEYKDDDRQLVADACTFDITLKRLAQLEKEHKQQQAKEVADARTLEQLQKSNLELRAQAKELEITTLSIEQERKDICTQLDKSRADLSHANDEQASLNDLVGLLRDEVKALPRRIEAQCRTQFEGLCTENAKLVEKNSVLEDQLANLETLVIDMKMRYAQSENERGELQQKLNEMKRLMGM